MGAGVPAEIWGGKREQGLGRCFKPARKIGVLDKPEVGENRETTDGREQKSEGKGTWDLGPGAWAVNWCRGSLQSGCKSIAP